MPRAAPRPRSSSSESRINSRATGLREVRMGGLIGRLVVGLALTTLTAAPGRAQNAPPEAGSAEITAVLDQEKPDPSRAARIRADADAPPPATPAGAFYF